MPKKFSKDYQPQDRARRQFKTMLMECIAENELYGVTKKATRDEIETAFVRQMLIESQDDQQLRRDLLNKAYPNARPVMEPVEFNFDKDAKPTIQIDQIMHAASTGHIPPDVANQMIQSIEKKVNVEANTELKDKVERLEKLINERISQEA